MTINNDTTNQDAAIKAAADAAIAASVAQAHAEDAQGYAATKLAEAAEAAEAAGIAPPEPAPLSFLTVDEILAAKDLPEREVEIPEWGGKVLVRGLSRRDYDAMSKAATVTVPATGPGQQPTTRVDAEKLSDGLILACVVNPRFTVAQLDALRDKSMGALTRIYTAITEVLGVDPKAQQAAKSPAKP